MIANAITNSPLLQSIIGKYTVIRNERLMSWGEAIDIRVDIAMPVCLSV